MVARAKAVKLTSKNVSAKNVAYNSVVFFVTPEISEARTVSYAEISDVRLPASILIWMGTPSRNFSINAKFLARSTAEANVAFRNLNLLKSWCVTNASLGANKLTKISDTITTEINRADATSPSDEEKVDAQDANAEKTSDPNTPTKSFAPTDSLFKGTPEVLLLEGYGGQFRNIPVVITGLNINFPSDTDYIKTTEGVWVPIYHEISISLKEAREISGRRGAIDQFNLTKFKQGTLEYW